MPIRRADDNLYALLTNGAATGAAVDIKGGQYAFVVDGTFGGATASLEFQATATGAWTTVNANGVAVSLTANGTRTPIDLPAGRVRIAIAGGTPSAMYSVLLGMG